MYTVIITRQFKATDMFPVIKIASVTLTEQYTPTLFTYFHETFPELFLVAEYYHKIVGFIIAVRINTKNARIVMLSVLPSYQRQQIGATLLKKLISILKKKKIEQIILEVRTDNKKAISFYEKMGFTIIDTLENFYQNGESAFMMKREFQLY